MNCKFCGVEISDEAVFCPECGKLVTEEPRVQATPDVEAVAPKRL